MSLALSAMASTTFEVMLYFSVTRRNSFSSSIIVHLLSYGAHSRIFVVSSGLGEDQSIKCAVNALYLSVATLVQPSVVRVTNLTSSSCFCTAIMASEWILGKS